MSGILSNFKKIKDYGKYKNRERILENEVIKATSDDSTFYDEYSSFIEGLQIKLDYILDEEGYKEVTFNPNGTKNAKYFRAVIDDEQFKTNYKINLTIGGEFTFELRTIEDFGGMVDER